MEDLSFATNADSMDAPSGYYYQSVDSSPMMTSNSFEHSSPGQSPPFYGSFEQSPQYYLDNSLDQSPTSQYHIQFQQQQSQEYAIQAQKGYSGSNLLNDNVSLDGIKPQPQSQPSQIPGVNELSKLFNMASKVEDKLAIQSKIRQIIFEHLKPQDYQIGYSSEQNGHQSALITPPLSPNSDNLMYMSKQNPMFMAKACSGLNSSLVPMNPMVKVEPLSPVHVQQQQQPINRKLSRSSFVDPTTAANVINTDSGLMVGGGQSPVAINAAVDQNNCSQKAIYFETAPSQQVQYGQQFELDTASSTGFNSNVSILVSAEPSSIPETVPIDENQLSTELKTNAAVKSKSKSKSKTRAKKSSEQKQLQSNGGSPKQSQKRSAHLSAEFRYRTKLNDKISKLRSLVGQKVHLSKSAVLTRSIERIIKLQKLTIRLHESNLRLQSLVAKYTNPPNQVQAAAAETNSKLMSIKELTRSLSTSSNTSSSRHVAPSQPIDIDLAKFMMVESERIPATIEPTLSAPTMPHNQSGFATEEVFDFDQFLEQF